MASTCPAATSKALVSNWISCTVPRAAASSFTAARPSAAAPAPADEPPVVRERSPGVRVMPVSGESPPPVQPNSGVVVAPRFPSPTDRELRGGAG